MIGLKKGQVAIVDYDSGWPKSFETEKSELAKILKGLNPVIEHVGSTAIAGMKAKPILDVVIGFHKVGDVERGLALLIDAGREYVKGANQPGMLFMAKGDPRTVHYHLVVWRTHAWEKLVVFRDHLRRHPGVASAYATHKQALAKRFPESRLDYANGKRAVLLMILNRAFQETKVRRHAAMRGRQLKDATE